MSLRDVLLDEMKDLYSAEKQLVKALPKMAKGAEDEELSNSIAEHLEQTRGHVQRLEQAFEHLGEKPRAKHCKGMEGLIEEGGEALEEDEEGASHDVLLIGAALRVEHYEKAAYSLAIEMAKGLGEGEVAELLQQTLEEESETAETLLEKGKELVEAASHEGEADEDADVEAEDEDETVSVGSSRKPTTPARKPSVPVRTPGRRTGTR